MILLIRLLITALLFLCTTTCHTCVHRCHLAWVYYLRHWADWRPRSKPHLTYRYLEQTACQGAPGSAGKKNKSLGGKRHDHGYKKPKLLTEIEGIIDRQAGDREGENISPKIWILFTRNIETSYLTWFTINLSENRDGTKGLMGSLTESAVAESHIISEWNVTSWLNSNMFSLHLHSDHSCPDDDHVFVCS